MTDTTFAPPRTGLEPAILVAYGLFLLGPLTGLTAIAGAILLYIKRPEAAGTVWQSHVRNLLLVFWVTVVLFAAVLALVLPGVATLVYSLIMTNGNPSPLLVGGLFAAAPLIGLAMLAYTVWYLYRVIAGLVRALDAKPY